MKIEKIDDLRQAWQTMGEDVPDLATQLKNLQSAWERRRRKMLRRFAIECGISFLIYATAITFIILSTDDVARKVFGMKVVLLSFVFFIPFTISFYRTIRQLSEKESSESMGSFIHRSVKRLRRLKRIYIAGNYAFCLLLLAAFWFDPFLASQPAWLQWGCYGVVLLLTVLTFPLWKISYGVDLKHFEKMEREWFEDSNPTP